MGWEEETVRAELGGLRANRGVVKTAKWAT